MSVIIHVQLNSKAIGLKLRSVTVRHSPKGMCLKICLEKTNTPASQAAAELVPHDATAGSIKEANSWLQQKLRQWKEA